MLSLSNHQLSAGVTATGEVAGLTANQYAFTTARAKWGYLGSASGETVTALYIDDVQSVVADGSAREAYVMLPDFSAHDVDAVAFPRWMIPPNTQYGGAVTTRAHLEWPAVSGATAYKIYRSSTVGGTYVLQDTVDTQSVVPTTYDSGDGTIRIEGAYYGTDTGTTYTVEVTDVREITFNGVTRAYVPNQLTPLLDGISCIVSPSCSVGDSASFLVGVQPKWDSAVLESGTYYYKVSSLDAAGNESAQSTAVAVTITAPPEPIGLPTLTAAGGDLVLSWTQPAHVESYRAYRNYDSDTDTITQTFQMFATADPGIGEPVSIVGLASYASRPSGTYRFYVRSLTGGVDDGTATIVETTLPYYDAALAVPSNVVATPTAAATATIVWVSDIPITTWTLAVAGGSTYTVTPQASQSAGVLTYSQTMTAVQLGAAGSKTVTVAVSGGVGAAVTFTTDSTAPDAPNGVIGTAF